MLVSACHLYVQLSWDMAMLMIYMYTATWLRQLSQLGGRKHLFTYYAGIVIGDRYRVAILYDIRCLL